jgi:DNA recombination protein RmuC
MDHTYIVPAVGVLILAFAGAFYLWRMQLVNGALRTSKAETERQLAVAEQKASRTEGLESSVAEKSKEADELRESKATLAEALAQTRQHLENTERARDALSTKLENTGNRLADVRTENAALQEKLEQERKQANAQVALLQGTTDQMTNQFKVLADDIMKQHGESFKRQNQEQLDRILMPLRDKLTEFQQGLLNAHNESIKDRAKLTHEIHTLTETSAKMTSETQSLTRALKGKSQTQGAWGEMVLKTVLDQSGLREGQEYLLQKSCPTEDGFRLRPDVIVTLPGGQQQVVIDAKVSLSAFTAYVNAETDAEREVQLLAHVSSMRNHIKELSQKEYQQAVASELTFVIMFVPIEGALAAALQKDPDLTGFATKNKIAIATPTTLIVALKTIGNLWQVDRRNRKAYEIADRAGRLYDKFVGFLSDMQSVGDRLTQAQTSYADAMGKLVKGRGNLAWQIEELKEMGASTGKSIPAALLDYQEPEATATTPAGVTALA